MTELNGAAGLPQPKESLDRKIDAGISIFNRRSMSVQTEKSNGHWKSFGGRDP